MTTQGPETIDVTGFLQKIIFPDVEEWVKSALKVNLIISNFYNIL